MDCLLFAIDFAIFVCYDGGEVIAMKRFFALLFALLLFALPAFAEGYEMMLPEGFSWIEGEELEGYLAAARADAGAEFSDQARLALNGEMSLSVVLSTTDQPDGASAAKEILDGYAAHIAGFESVEPEKVTIGETDFWRFSFAIDGQTATQYCTVHEGEMALITLIGAPEDALSGFRWNA